MKPAKKNNCPTKKSSGDNFSTPKIDSYFKAVAKQLNVEVDAQTETDEGDLKAIYIDALKEKLRGELNLKCFRTVLTLRPCVKIQLSVFQMNNINSPCRPYLKTF